MSAPTRLGISLPVDSPEIVEPTTGLTALAGQPVNGAGDRWIAGYDYRPEVPQILRTRSLATGELGTNIAEDFDASIVDTIPFLLTLEDATSTTQRTEDLEARATRMLQGYTTTLLEHEFWTGEMATADDLPNRHLSLSPESVGSGSISPQDAVALLVGKLAEHGIMNVMIHAPRSVAVRMPDSWQNENTLAQYGFVIVAGSGYPNVNEIRATQLVNVRLSEIEVEGGDQAVNIHDNTIRHYAKRVGAVDFAGPVLKCSVRAPGS